MLFLNAGGQAAAGSIHPKGKTGGAQHGQLQVAKITAYQQDNRNAEGEVIEILGEAGCGRGGSAGHYPPLWAERDV